MGRRFVVSIDLGTTYSAVAFYQYTGEPISDEEFENGTRDGRFGIHTSDLERIGKYPSASRNFKESLGEVPTELWFDCDSVEGVKGWGYTVHSYIKTPARPSSVRVKSIKLLLDRNERMLDECSDARETLNEQGLSVEDSITLFLTCLFGHTKIQLETYGYRDGDPIHLVGTVPATWDAQALTITTHAMERAAIQANFGAHRDIFLVSEPEAAATFFTENDTTGNFKLKASSLLGLTLL